MDDLTSVLQIVSYINGAVQQHAQKSFLAAAGFSPR
jgi:hypothetical protein